MERKIWMCATCTVEVDKPKACLPNGWAVAIVGNDDRKNLHLCPECLPKVLRQLISRYGRNRRDEEFWDSVEEVRQSIRERQRADL